jgi:mannose-6-phosphate isomerase-like protein (cupin superfamily)
MPKIVEKLPLGFAMARRSTDANDYQFVPRPLAAMSKSFRDGFEIAPHHHARDQLVYAVTGVMRVRTEAEAWIVPPDRAVYLPAHTVHSISIRGQVEMRTLYVSRDASDDLPATPTVLEVSPLLRELVLALIEEPVVYDEEGRGGAVAFLILAEIARARRLSLVIDAARSASPACVQCAAGRSCKPPDHRRAGSIRRARHRARWRGCSSRNWE